MLDLTDRFGKKYLVNISQVEYITGDDLDISKGCYLQMQHTGLYLKESLLEIRALIKINDLEERKWTQKN